MADLDRLYAALKAADAAGNSQDAAMLAQAIKASSAAPVPTAQPQTSQALGFEQSTGNFLANAAQPAIWAGKKLGLDMSGFEQGQDVIRNPEHAPNEQPGGVGKFVGTLPGYVGTAFAGPVVSGLAGGAFNSESKTPGGVAVDAGLSALGGKATDMALGGLKQTLLPRVVRPAVQSLLDAKIPLTMGQTVGGAMKSAEDKMTSWPVVGTAIKNAQGRGVDGLNRAAINRALAPVGETLPTAIPVGREAVDYAATTIGNKYDDILPKLSAQSDPQFITDMQKIIEQAKAKLPDQQYNQFQKIIQSQIAGKAGTGSFDGPTLQGINSELGRASSGYGADPSFDNRELGSVLGDARTALTDLVKRSNPDHADALKAADTAWANFARVRRAASAVGAKDGVFSAPQLANAVRASDKSAGKGAYARGNALMQDLSDPANSVLPSSVPDSGTAGRLLLMDMARNPAMALPGLAAAGVYSGPGQALARSLFGARQGYPGAVTAINRARLPLSITAASLPHLIGSQN